MQPVSINQGQVKTASFTRRPNSVRSVDSYIKSTPNGISFCGQTYNSTEECIADVKKQVKDLRSKGYKVMTRGFGRI